MSWYDGLEHIVREQESLANWNWLRLGGAAEFFAEPTTVDELQEILQRTHAASIPVRPIGGGSNILVPDDGIAGVVVLLSAPVFCEISVNADSITAGGGAKLNHVVSTAAREGLAGLEALVGIPGTIGGALRTNAIGHGAAIGQWTKSVQALTRSGERVALDRDDLRFGYRESNLDDLIVLEAEFALERGNMLKVTRQMQKLWILKRTAQPNGNLGHALVFGSPRGMTAGEIIEQANLKGLRFGGAAICETNPEYIEVQPGTSSSDVAKLISETRRQVSDIMGVELEPEIQVW